MIAAFVTRVGVGMLVFWLGAFCGLCAGLGLGLCGRDVRAWWERRRRAVAETPATFVATHTDELCACGHPHETHTKGRGPCMAVTGWHDRGARWCLCQQFHHATPRRTPRRTA